jgi:hypothetical protein
VKNRQEKLSDLEARTRAELSALVEQPDVPVLAGPWLGEVGFELLYWLPFLRWAVREYPPLRGQLVVLSRGGVSSWYAGLADRYLDLFDFFTLREFRTRFPKFLKQTPKHEDYGRREYPAGEQALIDLVMRHAGLQRLNVLHPSLMFRSFKLLYEADPRGIAAFFPPMEAPALGAIEEALPPQYVAVRFYQTYTLPSTEANLNFVQALVDRLADHLAVVLLNTGLTIDRKHPDFPPRPGSKALTLERFMTPANNLGVQSAVISRAVAYVGNHGGLSYLAPHFRIPSYTVYSDEGFIKHRELATMALDRPNLGGYWVGCVDDMTPASVADLVARRAMSDRTAAIGRP